MRKEDWTLRIRSLLSISKDLREGLAENYQAASVMWTEQDWYRAVFLTSTCKELRYLLVGETSQGSSSGERENGSDST